MDSAYAVFKKNEIWMINLHLDTKKYEFGLKNVESVRPKKILLNRKEIQKISLKIKNNGFTMIPLDLHFNNKGFIKILIGYFKRKKKTGSKRI